MNQATPWHGRARRLLIAAVPTWARVTGPLAVTVALGIALSAAITPLASAAPTASDPAAQPAVAAQPFKGVAGPACGDVTRLNLSWYYNWWISPGSCTAPGFVPTISGKSEKTAGDIGWALDQIRKSGYGTVLGFNEPNKADQANMTVARAIELWPALTADPNIRVSSPSTSGDGQAWFTEFLRQADAKKLRVDFLNIHWYGWNAGSCDANAASFESYLRWAESLPGNRPIWITEFGCMNQSNPNRATVQAFYSAALRVLARHPRVERHSWYPYLANNELVESGGALTPLGTILANAPANR